VRAVSSEENNVVVRVGGPVDELSVAVCLYSETLEPEELTALLGVEATSSHRRGERKGPRSPPFKKGAWIFSRRFLSAQDSETAILEHLEQLPADQDLWREILTKYEVQVRFGVFQNAWNQGFGLSPEAVQRIGVFGAHVVFDIYCECDDSDVNGA
jgi:hypothetical protein